jgi:hypothetical protein
MVSKLSYLLIFFLLASCNDFKLNLVDSNKYFVKSSSQSVSYDSVTERVEISFSLLITDKKGAPVSSIAPTMYYEHAETSARMDPVCSVSNTQGESQCTLTVNSPSDVMKLTLKSIDQKMKVDQGTSGLEVWPGPEFSSITPSPINHDLSSQTVTLSGQHFHPGMRIHVGGVECTDVIVTSEVMATCTLGADTAGPKTVLLRGLDGHEKSFVSAVERRDITAPAAPVATLSSPGVSSGLALTFTVSDCLDKPYILVSESPLAPSSSDPSWQSCVTTSSGIISTLIGPATQGTHTLYLFAKDLAGNVSPSTDLSMVYDSAAPTVTLASVPSSLQGGASLSLNFSASDVSGISSLLLQYAADGSTFNTIQTLATSATTYSWTIPSSNISGARLRIVAADGATPANTALAVSGAFAIDSTAPSAPSVALTSGAYSNSTTIALTVSSCTDTAHILVNGGASPSTSDVGWAPCTTSAGGITTMIPANQGPHNLHVWAKDASGNISSTATIIGVTYDTVPPVLTPSTIGYVKGASSVPVSFTLTEAHSSALQSISFTYNNGTTTTTSTLAAKDGPLTNEPFVWSMSTPLTDNTALDLKIDYTDLAGNHSRITLLLTTDTTAPTVTSFILNSGATSTFNNNVTVSFAASDATSNITKFCLKYNSPTAPLANDSCWRNVDAPTPGVTPAPSISFSNYFFQLGFTKANYIASAWAMDEAGHISTNIQTTNVDQYEMSFDPGSPPSITKLTATNSDSAPYPAPSTALVVNSGDQLYIKWSASDTEGLSPNPISIFYSLDGTTYVPLLGGSDLPNGVNGSCTIDPSLTGCVVLAAPSSSYFKVRVVAKDQLNTSVFYSTPLNDARLRIIAGNPEDGLEGSARSALFFVRAIASNSPYGFKNALVAAEDGKYFYIDPVRGLIWVDPENGILKRFITVTGTSSGDGGLVSSATLQQASQIALDHQNNLLIWDLDRIRKVDLRTMIISTMIGGGNTPDPVTVIPAANIKLNSRDMTFSTFTPLPNGDVVFSGASTARRFWRYRAADQMIAPINIIDSVGMGLNPSEPWASRDFADLGLEYNESTSAFTFLMQNFIYSFVGDTHILSSRLDMAGNDSVGYAGIGPYDISIPVKTMTTGLNGKIYVLPRVRLSLETYDPSTNTLIRILGTAVAPKAPCPELTPALSCPVDIDTYFISKTGRPYFIDQGLLRSLNENGQVITLAGEYASYGNGVPSVNARFGSIQDIQYGSKAVTDNKIIILDSFASTYREMLVNGNISTLTDACFTWHGPWAFATDTVSGDIFSPCSDALRRFERSPGVWTNIVGGGGTAYYSPSSEGLPGSAINLESGYNGFVMGYVNNQVFYNKYSWNGTTSYAANIKSYDVGDLYRQSHFMGTMAYGGSYADGNPMATTSVAQDIAKIEFSTTLNKYLFLTHGGALWTGTHGGTLNMLVFLVDGPNNFTHVSDVSGLNIYYCGGSGKLWKYNVDTLTYTPLVWNSSSLTCNVGASVLYRSSTNSLIFAGKQNGLGVVLEYDLN